jgi:hypothetical protein
MHTRMIGTAALALLLAPAAVVAQGFEGVISMKLTGGGQDMELTQYVKGARTRQEFSGGPMGAAAMIIDGTTGKVMMLVDEQKMYMVMEAGSAAAADAPDGPVPEITATGRKDNIAGHACEYYQVKMPEGGTVEICAATGLGYYTRFNDFPGGRGGRRGGGAAATRNVRFWQEKFSEGFFPLKTVTTQNGQTMTMEVTKIEKKSVSDDLFTPPAGYTEMKMPGRGAGAGSN